jgi:hypothetical protein
MELTEFAQPCPICGSSRITLVQIPSYTTHDEARRYGVCDRFSGWEPKPENQQKRQQHKKAIVALLKSAQLAEWERIFLTEISKQKRLSPKQQAFLEQFAARFERRN